MKTFSLALLLVCCLCARGQSDKKGRTAYTVQYADSLYIAGQWKAAIPVYESLLKKDPGNISSWNRLGFCYHNLGDYASAVECYRGVLKLNPDSLHARAAYSRLAMVMAIQNENDKAFGHLDAALRYGYMLAGELQTGGDFENLRSDKRFDGFVQRAARNAAPCMDTPQSRQFDFWIGRWDVYTKESGRLAGESIIQMASGGCLILENWTSKGLTPFTGKSMNYINPETGRWEQLWVGSDGVNRNNPQKFINGEYRDGVMRFEFEQWSPEGNKQSGRFMFYNEGPDQVRQFNEVSDDGGKTWTTVYDLVYKRKKETTNSE